MAFYENYVQLCNSVGKSPSAVAMSIGFSNAAATGWKNGAVPRETALLKIADYFGVSVEYLKGEETKKDLTLSGEVSLAQKALIDMVYQMSDDECRRLADLIAAAKKL